MRTHLLTTLGTTLTRPTGTSLNQLSRQRAALGSEDVPGLRSNSHIHRYADFIFTAISSVVDKAIPKSKSERSENNPISENEVGPRVSQARIKQKNAP